jgi:hypothetical protein
LNFDSSLGYIARPVGRERKEKRKGKGKMK